MRESENTITFTVIDERSDHIGIQEKPLLFRIQKDRGGYGFYLWHDENGHYVEDVTIGSPADKAGLLANYILAIIRAGQHTARRIVKSCVKICQNFTKY